MIEYKGLGICRMAVIVGSLGCCSYAMSATLLSDGGLSDESDLLERVIPPIVEAMEQDVKKPVQVQNALNKKIAKKHTDSLIQDYLDASVLSEHEEQKKITEPTRTSVYLQQQIPELPPYQEKIRLDKLNFSGPQTGNAKGDVTVSINR